MAQTNAGDPEAGTARYGLPLLYPGQAHKEVHHNEALARLDLLANMVVEGIAEIPDGLTPEPGQCWLISGTASGIWTERRGCIAGFIDGDWVYFPPQDGQVIQVRANAARMVFRFGFWRMTPTMAQPSGGGVVDNEAREAILMLRDALELYGLILPA
ncbi:MAG: DUF2793 domain-containing protein [Pseudomonadota bacterium]